MVKPSRRRAILNLEYFDEKDFRIRSISGFKVAMIGQKSWALQALQMNAFCNRITHIIMADKPKTPEEKFAGLFVRIHKTSWVNFKFIESL